MLFWITLLSHAGALLIAMQVPVSLAAQLPLAGLILASLVWHWRQGAWRPAGRIRLDDDGGCTFGKDDRAGAQRRRVVRASRHAGFVCLTLKTDGRRSRPLLVARDALDADSYRELCSRIVQRRLPRHDQFTAEDLL